jgi:hypothetical protein
MPSQFSVGTSCGGEIMLRAARHWIHENGQQNICVLLQKDIRNSFNEILPHEFLKDAQQYAPASARFAICYYGNPINLVYQGCIVKCNRGQQGCPIMGPLFCLIRQRMTEEARSRNTRPPTRI